MAYGGGFRMIQLFIKESTRNSQRMTVRDDRGQILYIIEGRWGRKNDVTSIYTFDGDLIMSVKQTKNTPFPIFKLKDSDGESMATMRKHPGLFGIRDSYFTIQPLDWVVKGDFEELYFTVYKEKQFIMECEKDIYNNYTVYELSIQNEEDAPLCALISILFDPHARNKVEDEQNESYEKSDYDFGFNAFSIKNIKPKIQTKR